MIKFCKTTLGEEEKKAIADVIDNGWVVMGKKTEEFEQKFAEYVGSKYAVFVDSGTAALNLSVAFLTQREKFEIAVPSFTFTATAEAVLNQGCDIKFIDVDIDSMCVDKYENPVIAVNLGGRQALTKAMIYDSAHRIEKEGYSGGLECHSFYATKNMTTIQGGMIVTDEEVAYNWMKKARDHGLDMTTEQRYKGKYAQYDIEFIGWRLKADDVKAAIGLEQLKKLPKNTERRNEIVKMYNNAFGYKREGNHLYIVTVKDQKEFMEYMIKNEIQTAINYRPLHTMTAYKDYKREKLPNTEWLGQHVVSLPLYPDLTNEEVDYVIEKVNDFSRT